MRRKLQQLVQLLAYTLTALGALLLALWAVRGLRPALACGLLDTLLAADWAGAYTCLDQADYDPLIGILTLGSGALLWVGARLAAPPAATEAARRAEVHARNRAEMIRRVRDIWIDGVLKHSLYAEVPIDLRMDKRPGALPWGMTSQRIGAGEQPVAPGTSIAALFAEADSTLVILGAPGAGKSTALLELARALLDRAAVDPAAPIPIVLNLSTHARQPGSQQGAQHPALAAWAASELARFYHVPPAVAAAWLEEGELALLLDGLDEVSAARRAAVVAQINDYLRRRLHAPLAVCCREAEYAALAQGVAAGGVVRLLPLDAAQIDAYLAALQGDAVQQVTAALAADAAMAELAQTPLLLNVMLLASGELHPKAEARAEAAVDARTRLYDAYLRVMLRRDRTAGLKREGRSRRRGKAAAYAPEDTVRWLRWLAGKVNAEGRAVFLLERMGKAWFNRPYHWLVWPLVLVLALVPISGLIFGLAASLISTLNVGLSFGLVVGLVFGLVGGLGFGLGDIKVREAAHLNINSYNIAASLVLGIVLGLVLGPAGRVAESLLVGLPYRLLLMLVSVFVGALIGAVISGLVLSSTELESNYQAGSPNMGTVRSLQKGAVIGLIIGSVIGAFGVLAIGRVLGLALGLISGLITAFKYGLVDVLKHYLLRLVLWLDGSLPLRYVRFLDHCTNRILLRRVGGGYTFIHRTFQDYIATVDIDRLGL